MSSRVRVVIRKLDAIHQKTVEFNETHPPVTKLLPAQADNQRTFTEIGEKGITCSLACHGANIPREYDRTKTMVNVFQFGIQVPDYESKVWGPVRVFWRDVSVSSRQGMCRHG